MKKRSREIYSWFKKKYGFGELGLFEAIAISSIFVKNLKFAVSTVIIAPSGEAKTDTLDDIDKMLSDYCIIKKGLVTEYWISRHIPEEKLDKHMFCVGDLADSLKAMQSRRIAGFLAFMKNVIDGKAEILTAHDNISYNVNKVGILVNIPKQIMSSVTGDLITTTFFDRTIPFQFATKWEEWSDLYLKKKLVNSSVEPIILCDKSIRIPSKFEKRIVDEAKFLMKLKFSGLPRNIHLVKAFLCGSALLNNKDKVSIDDFETFELMKPFFRW